VTNGTGNAPITVHWLRLNRLGFGVAIMVLGAMVSARAVPPTADQVSAWEALNHRVTEAYQAGKAGEAVSVAEQAVALAKASFGLRDPRTLTSMNNLAFLRYREGRYGEAEPLFRETLQLSREVLGPRDPHTLSSMNNLALVLEGEGRYSEAEALDRETLQLSRETLGPRHPHTLTTMSNLAEVLDDEGRYGEAEPLYREALQLNREALGPRHPDTLTSMSNVAAVLFREGRYGEAEALDRETLQLRRDVLGPRHPDTLASMNNLAAVLKTQGRNGEGEPLFRETLQLRREALGPRHPDTLISMNNLAAVLDDEGRYGEAETLYRETMRLRREALGPQHPDTLTTMNDLASTLELEGRYGEAEPLYRDALDSSGHVLGPAHPTTLLTQLNMIVNLAAQRRVDEAAALQRQMEPQVLAWLGAELYATEAAAARRQLVASQSTYQDVALSLALLPSAGASASELAASALLRFKSLAVEEEAYLARLERRSSDPRIRTLATEIKQLHQHLAKLFQGGGSGAQVKDLTAELDAKELELGQISRDYAPYLQVKSASLQDLRASLPPKSGLLELRAYHLVDFKTGRAGDWRWAGALIAAEGEIEVRDLGAATDTAAQVQAILTYGPSAEAATAALSEQLLAPFAARIAKLQRLYVGPDGALDLLPFGLLHDATGRRLMESLDLRLVQTGRDLLRPAADHPAKGLVAVGGIEFNAAENQATVADAQSPPADELAQGSPDAGPMTRTRAAAAEAFRDGFAALSHSKEEVEAIGRQYQIERRDEPVSIVEGDQPTKAWLMALPPPRVLHLATHGFYRAPKEPADQPMLLAGVALAGANQSLKRQDASGILYALEAEDLNLEGTELVVLSACDTALGQIDYGEGVSGLVRALRTAGVRNVLVTLRPVDDAGAEQFMERFYFYWFKQPRSDPAAALRDAQREAAVQPDPTWSSFVLIGD
jgi:CHAT domain-containing protein/tetratricopeptide (TPR) repeat protein